MAEESKNNSETFEQKIANALGEIGLNTRRIKTTKYGSSNFLAPCFKITAGLTLDTLQEIKRKQEINS